MYPLLNAVEQAIQQNADEVVYQDWQLKRVYGGMNGIIYRAENSHAPENPIVMKIRKSDERKRATREFLALQVLDSLSLAIAPKPMSLHINLTSLQSDVVIASWIDGDVLDNLSDAPFHLWESILTTFCKFHAIQPADAPHITNAVVPVHSIHDVITEIERRYAKLPEGKIGQITKADIRLLWEEFKAVALRDYRPTNQIGLITCDANPHNMVHHKGQILVIDWENSGWADPAFDIADLLVRPNCATIAEETRMKIIHQYAEMMNNPHLSHAILVYERVMLIFWLILTSNGFIANNNAHRLQGVRTFSHEQTTQQQLAYLQRIENARKQ